MEFMEESLTVQPKLSLLNRYAQKAKRVAIKAIKPVFDSAAEVESQRRSLQGYRIQVEGPTRHLSYFNRMIDRANLRLK